MRILIRKAMKKICLSIAGVLVAGLLILFSLSNRSMRVVMNEAEARMTEEPVRALELLDSIAPGQSEWSRAMRARFSLLYTCAQDKNRIDVDDDSLIVRAVDYYKNRGDHRTRAMAYYYYGVIRHNAGDIDGAMEALVKAQLEAEECDDSYLQGLIYSELGNAYYYQYTYSEASEMYIKAICEFEKCNLQENIFIVQYCCGLSLFLDNKFSQAIDYLSSALQLAIKDKNVDAILDIEAVLIHMKIKRGVDYGSLISLKQRLFKRYELYNKNIVPITHYPVLGSIYVEEHKIDSARYYITEYLKSNIGIGLQNFGIWAMLSLVERESGNYKLAYDYNRRYSHYNDSINMSLRDYDARALERKYKNKELKSSYLNLQLKHRKERIGAIVLLVILIVCAWSAYHYFMRKRAKEREMYDISIGEFRRYCSELEKGCEALKEGRNADEEQYQSLLKLLEKRVTDMKKISEWATLYEKSPDVFYQKVKEYFHLSNSTNRVLVGEVLTFANLYCFGIIDYLRSICPKLTPRELCYCGLSCLGFSPECIRILFNHTNISSIYTIRNKVRNKLGLKRSSFNLEKHIRDLLNEAKDRLENKEKACE